MKTPQHISLIISDMNIFSKEKLFLNRQQNVRMLHKEEGSGNVTKCQRNIRIIFESKCTPISRKRTIREKKRNIETGITGTKKAVKLDDFTAQKLTFKCFSSETMLLK